MRYVLGSSQVPSIMFGKFLMWYHLILTVPPTPNIISIIIQMGKLRLREFTQQHVKLS